MQAAFFTGVSGGGCGHSVYRSADGSGGGVCTGAERFRNLCNLHGASALGLGCTLLIPDLSTGLDAAVAPAREYGWRC